MHCMVQWGEDDVDLQQKFDCALMSGGASNCNKRYLRNCLPMCNEVVARAFSVSFWTIRRHMHLKQRSDHRSYRALFAGEMRDASGAISTLSSNRHAPGTPPASLWQTGQVLSVLPGSPPRRSAN